jgi:hypothetical protein
MKLNKILYTTFYETCVVSSSKNYANENLMYGQWRIQTSNIGVAKKKHVHRFYSWKKKTFLACSLAKEIVLSLESTRKNNKE